MSHTRTLHIMLALLTAFWTPFWCCCVSHGSPVTETSIITSSTACPNCPASTAPISDPDSRFPDSPHDDCPACPHSTLRAWMPVDKSPQVTTSAMVTFFLLHLDVTHLELPASNPCIALATSDTVPRSACASLLSLHCMLTI